MGTIFLLKFPSTFVSKRKLNPTISVLLFHLRSAVFSYNRTRKNWA